VDQEVASGKGKKRALSKEGRKAGYVAGMTLDGIAFTSQRGVLRTGLYTQPTEGGGVFKVRNLVGKTFEEGSGSGGKMPPSASVV